MVFWPVVRLSVALKFVPFIAAVVAEPLLTFAVTVAFGSSRLPVISTNVFPVTLLSAGMVIVRTGAVRSRVMVRVSVVVLLALSEAIVVMVFSPLTRVMARVNVPLLIVAVWPLTVTLLTPPPMSPTVPATFRVALLVVALSARVEMVKVGPVVV